jgi:hypothetical protein
VSPGLQDCSRCGVCRIVHIDLDEESDPLPVHRTGDASGKILAERLYVEGAALRALREIRQVGDWVDGAELERLVRH